MARIGLDVTMLANQRTGVENYTRALALNLPGTDPKLEFVFFSARPVDNQFNAVVVASRTDMSHALWRQFRLPRLLREYRVDLFHSPVAAVPIRWNGLLVATIHDLTWHVCPQAYPVRRRLAHRLWCKLSARIANRIVVPSSASAQLLRRLNPGLPESRIEIIAECAPQPAHHGIPTVSQRALLDKLAITPPFFLAVGTLQAHKNYERLIQAFEKLESQAGKAHQLVIVGKDGFGAERIHAAARASSRAKQVRLIGYVDDESLSVLYRSADVFVYPSLSEGFGLPVLEAMAVGTPVAASNASSIPEVGGDAACYFDPRNVEQMAHSIHRALADNDLRTELVRKGKERVTLFSPKRMASATVALYRETLEDDPNRSLTSVA
jgi:glycosyltransferase involved in cell wall biosynthesis